MAEEPELAVGQDELRERIVAGERVAVLAPERDRPEGEKPPGALLAERMPPPLILDRQDRAVPPPRHLGVQPVVDRSGDEVLSAVEPGAEALGAEQIDVRRVRWLVPIDRVEDLRRRIDDRVVVALVVGVLQDLAETGRGECAGALPEVDAEEFPVPRAAELPRPLRLAEPPREPDPVPLAQQCLRDGVVDVTVVVALSPSGGRDAAVPEEVAVPLLPEWLLRCPAADLQSLRPDATAVFAKPQHLPQPGEVGGLAVLVVPRHLVGGEHHRGEEPHPARAAFAIRPAQRREIDAPVRTDAALAHRGLEVPDRV